MLCSRCGEYIPEGKGMKVGTAHGGQVKEAMPMCSECAYCVYLEAKSFLERLSEDPEDAIIRRIDLADVEDCQDD